MEDALRLLWWIRGFLQTALKWISDPNDRPGVSAPSARLGSRSLSTQRHPLSLILDFPSLLSNHKRCHDIVHLTPGDGVSVIHY